MSTIGRVTTAKNEGRHEIRAKGDRATLRGGQNLAGRPGYTWTKVEAGQWQFVLGLVRLDYATVSDLCEVVGIPRPSAQSEAMRARLLGRLLSSEGRALYARVAAERAQLLEQATELGNKARAEAALAADIRDRKGRRLTAPKSMRLVELRALLAAHAALNPAPKAEPADEQVEQSAPNVTISARVSCENCGREFCGGYDSRCPVCGSAHLRVAA